MATSSPMPHPVPQLAGGVRPWRALGSFRSAGWGEAAGGGDGCGRALPAEGVGQQVDEDVDGEWVVVGVFGDESCQPSGPPSTSATRLRSMISARNTDLLPTAIIWDEPYHAFCGPPVRASPIAGTMRHHEWRRRAIRVTGSGATVTVAAWFSSVEPCIEGVMPLHRARILLAAGASSLMAGLAVVESSSATTPAFRVFRHRGCPLPIDDCLAATPRLDLLKTRAPSKSRMVTAR
jgi:hypothetical protein